AQAVAAERLRSLAGPAARNTMSRKTVMPARSSATSWFAGIRLAAADRRELSLPEFLWQVFSLNRGIRHRRGKSWHSQLFDKCLMPFELARDLRQLVVQQVGAKELLNTLRLSGVPKRLTKQFAVSAFGWSRLSVSIKI